MKNFLKNRIIKTISIVILVIGGCVFLFSIPKIFSTVLLKTIEFLDDSPKIDSNGETIYEDGRHTITSFGNRNRFAIEKCSSKEKVTWYLFDRDKNKDIDIDIEVYEYIRPYIIEKDSNGRYNQIYLPEDELKPYVYTKGSKGYTKLNYETAEVKQSQDINDFSQEDQEVFKKLDAGEGCKKIIKDK